MNTRAEPWSDTQSPPDFVEHANGCIGINSMQGTVTDVASSAAKMRRLLGEGAVRESEKGLTLTVPSGQRIHLARSRRAALESMTLRVQDLQRLDACLRDAGIDVEHDTPEVVTVAREYACGCVLKFTEQAPG